MVCRCAESQDDSSSSVPKRSRCEPDEIAFPDVRHLMEAGLYFIISESWITYLCRFTHCSTSLCTSSEKSPSSRSRRMLVAACCVSLRSRTENCFQAGSLRLPAGRPTARAVRVGSGGVGGTGAAVSVASDSVMGCDSVGVWKMAANLFPRLLAMPQFPFSLR